ncbi:MAG: hypothetical protein KAG99_10775 [Bacteroidales bacterium]|nr:hypothetical protein [Bacteroidales bacterium]
MKRKSKFFVLLMALTFILGVSNAQEKYAVLITGDYAISDIPLEEQWNQGQGKDENGYFPEFWYDTYLMWEMLVKDPEQGGFGYTDENVFVLFANGEDFYFENMWERYNADISYPVYYPITDYSATYSNVEAVFTGLATGTGGFPQITEDDFLFVWTFDHGGPLELVPGPVYIQLMDETMWDYKFAELTDQIPAHKKVFWMQQCRSGGFCDDLEAPNTVFHSSCQPLESSFVADNLDINGNTVEECEHVNWEDYRHGEFNFHTYSATVGESPKHVNNYNGQPYTEADENNDNYISVLESYDWEESHESIDYGGQHPGEVPLYSDIGDIGEYTSLEYPTLLCTDITQNETHRGLIGISKNVHVTSGKQLKFITNAKIFLLNDADLVVDAGATLIIEDGVTITGTNAGNKIEVDGLLEVGQNVTFTSTGLLWNLYLNNHSLQVIFENTTFEKCVIHNYGESLTISNSTFDDCFMANSHRGNVTVSDSTNFYRTWLYLENTEANDNTAMVSNCNFTTDYTMVAIDLWNYNLYDISNNTIDGYYNGIQIWQSGYGQAKSQMISDNTITNCTHQGILAYGTRGTVYRNHITNNAVGVWFGDHSSIRLHGYFGAQNLSETQTIKDNDSYEVYASHYSFPFYFRYNGIIDEDNSGAPQDPLVYHSYSGGSLIVDVRYNCWGENFDPEEDFYPDDYLWEPI